MKIIALLLLLLFNHQPANSKKIDINAEWVEPLKEVIERLRNENWIEHTLTENVFNMQKDEILTFLKDKKSSWKKYVVIPASIEERVSKSSKASKKQEEYGKKDYVKNVFISKPGTLVFILKEYPDIVIKIDKRPPDAIGKSERNYYDAYVNSSKIRAPKDFPFKYDKINFDHLYFPFEYGEDSTTLDAKVVLSEKIPFFSEADIDNLALLIELLDEAKDDIKIKKQLTTMYKQMLQYICMVGFSDIKLRNLPLTADGRLSPFDTDTASDELGILDFLKQYFGVQIFEDFAAVKNAINENDKDLYVKCRPEDRLIKTTLNPFNDDKEIKENKEEFRGQTEAAKKIGEFFRKRASDTPEEVENDWTNFSLELPKGQKEIAQKIGKIFSDIMKKNIEKNTKLLGQRCQHISSLRGKFEDTIKKKNIDNAWAILKEGQKIGLVFRALEGDIASQSIPFPISLENFICF